MYGKAVVDIDKLKIISHSSYWWRYCACVSITNASFWHIKNFHSFQLPYRACFVLRYPYPTTGYGNHIKCYVHSGWCCWRLVVSSFCVFTCIRSIEWICCVLKWARLEYHTPDVNTHHFPYHFIKCDCRDSQFCLTISSVEGKWISKSIDIAQAHTYF